MCVVGVIAGRGGRQGSVFLAAPGPGKSLSPLPEPSSSREMAPSLLLRLFFFCFTGSSLLYDGFL